MRRSDREITDERLIADIMVRCEFVHVAMNDGAFPYLLPFNFGMSDDGMNIYIHGAMDGRKYTVLEKDNRVRFSMVCTHGLDFDKAAGECSMNYESVIGTGRVEEITDFEEKIRALDAIMAHYRGENFPYHKEMAKHTRVLCIRVETRTAKRRVMAR